MTENSKRLSQRAAALSQEFRRIQADTERTADEAKKALDDKLREYIATAEPGERDSFIEIAMRHGVALPSDLAPTTPRVAPPEPERPTKPSPAELAASRQEPSWAPVEPTRAGPSPVPTSGPKVLVVDDDPDVRSAVVDTLGDEGIRVWQAGDGEEAIFRLGEMNGRIDLILLDLMMPRIDGFGVLRFLDRTPALADIPVLIISGGRPQRGELSAYLNDARVFLGKPLDRDALLETVRQYVDVSRARRA